MKKLMITSAMTLLLGFAGSANAAPGDVAVGAKIGTLGAGLELTVEAADKLNFRFGGNYFKLSKTVDIEGNDYDLDLKLNSYTALADWYVTDSSFRITGGAVINNNKLDGTALSSNTYDIGGQTFTSAETGVLTADVNFNTVAPYLGIGWGNPLSDDSDWTVSFDLGIIFTGKPKLDITSTGGTLSGNPILENEIVEAEQDFEDTDELKYLKYYPVVSLGLNYRF